MTWAQIRVAFLQAVGRTPAAGEECWDHLMEGQRIVWNRVDVPETAIVDPSFAITAGADSVELSGLAQEAFAILDVFNVTDGVPVYPEPGGMTGRNSYLQADTGKPPNGRIIRYQHDGTKLWVRDTPEANTTLRVRARRQPPSLSDSDLNSSPILPQQYHWPIVWAAARNYSLSHEMAAPEGQQPRHVTLAAALEESLRQDVVTPRAEEDRSRRESYRMQGYALGRLCR